MSATTVSVEDLEQLLPPYVGQQRWYGGGADDQLIIRAVDVLRPAWPGMIRVAFDAQAGGRYQTFLGLRPVGSDPVGEVNPIGVVRLPEGDAVCFDAIEDPELCLALLHRVDASQVAGVPRAIGAEQSNTSVVFDERLILKLFRRLVGANPEVEATVGLTKVGFDHVAAPLAVWREGEDDLAILQPFLVGGAEGWALALTSLRALLDEGGEPAASGGDLAPEAGRLGEMTAEMHLAFANAFGAERGDAGGWADAIEVRAKSVHHPDLNRDAINARLAVLRRIGDAGASIRIHGDYHLGQVMRTDDGWYVLDFEGEPTRPVEERRQPSSALRDVAGMLRSFSYVSAVGLRDRRAASPDLSIAAAWEQRNRAAFLDAYFARLSGSPLLPADTGSTLALVDAFELDKAIYEVSYEAAHRPDWVEIPLDAVRRLTERT